MSTDYCKCDVCGETFTSDDPCCWCDDCGHTFCGPDCAGMKPIAPEKKKRFKKAVGNVINYEGESYDPHNCAICRGTFEELADEVAFKYLLRVFKMTSETAMKLIRGDILNNGAKI